MSELINGRAWCFGDDIDTDIIAPAQHLVSPDPKHWAEHVMEPLDPEFSRRIKSGDLLVARNNFGSGSSREHAAIALKVAGIGAVIADSFARVFYRNALNNGLPVLECPGAADRIEQGDSLQIDLVKGEVLNRTRGETLSFVRMPAFLLEMLEKGGLLPYIVSQPSNRT